MSETLENAESRVMELESLRESVESLQLKLTESEAKIAEDERTVLEWQSKLIVQYYILCGLPDSLLTSSGHCFHLNQTVFTN